MCELYYLSFRKSRKGKRGLAFYRAEQQTWHMEFLSSSGIGQNDPVHQRSVAKWQRQSQRSKFHTARPFSGVPWIHDLHLRCMISTRQRTSRIDLTKKPWTVFLRTSLTSCRDDQAYRDLLQVKNVQCSGCPQAGMFRIFAAPRIRVLMR